jgi:hypothetical protein
MKKTLLLVLLVLLFVSCRKEPDIQKFMFSPTYANGTESIKFDSIAYTTITYSDLAVLADSHTVDLDVKAEYLSLKGGHTYSFKKFDMIGKSGKVLYYIPLRGDTASGSLIMPLLPINFRIPEEAASLVVNVIRYPY